MNSNRVIGFSRLLILTLLLMGVGCRTHKAPKVAEPLPPPPPPINTIRIGDFKCDNTVTAQAVRNVFIEVLGRNRFVKVVRVGEADVVVEGTVTIARAGSSTGSIAGGANWIAGGSQSTGGEYVSGVTSIAFRSDEILTSASWGQAIGKGKKLLPPESVAREAAVELLRALYRRGLRRE